jgi:hypothetical protein
MEPLPGQYTGGGPNEFSLYIYTYTYVKRHRIFIDLAPFRTGQGDRGQTRPRELENHHLQQAGSTVGLWRWLCKHESKLSIARLWVGRRNPNVRRM